MEILFLTQKLTLMKVDQTNRYWVSSSDQLKLIEDIPHDHLQAHDAHHTDQQYDHDHLFEILIKPFDHFHNESLLSISRPGIPAK